MKKLKNSYKWIILIIIAVSPFLYLKVTNAGIPPKAHDFTIPADAVYKPGELLVRFAPNVDGKQLNFVEKNQVLSLLGGGTIKKSFKIVPGLTLVKLPTGLTVKDALKTFNKTDGILYAEPNYRVRALSTFPNDTYFDKQWHLHNTGQNPPGGTYDADIDAPEGWDIQTGSSEIIVAVIDTGVDYEHEDLEDNMWINEPELNGTPDYDDDGNGYEDDIYGYDFCNYDADPIDDEGHGTACAGLVGAVGNNGTGVAGVCWNVKIMSIKFLDEYGGGWTADAIDSVQYADLMDARVMSNSWGGGGYSEGLEGAIKAAKANGVVFIAASGNSGGSVIYPARYAEAIAVGATDEDDVIWYYSGHGSELDVVAPSGEIGPPPQGNLWTTDITGEGYGYDNRDPLIFDYTDKMGGTSGATPQVAGLAGLILSINPDLFPDEVQFIIQSTADDKGDSGWDEYYGWGRINANEALYRASIYSVFRVKNDSGQPVADFDNFGNLFLKGTLDEESSHSAGSNDEFIVEDSSSELAIIDSTDGNMYITGQKHENQNMSLLSPEGFIIKNSNGEVVAYIDDSGDESGHLYLAGKLYQNPE